MNCLRYAIPLLGLLCLTSGCALCSAPDDYTYPTYGGAWERIDRCCGRVGSIFAPAGVRVADEQGPYEWVEDPPLEPSEEGYYDPNEAPETLPESMRDSLEIPELPPDTFDDAPPTPDPAPGAPVQPPDDSELLPDSPTSGFDSSLIGGPFADPLPGLPESPRKE